MFTNTLYLYLYICTHVYPVYLNLSDIIKIIGPKTNIVKARDELLDLLKYHLAHGNQEIMKIPSKAVPYLIGKSGVTIDRIKLESDCKIDFSTGHDDKFESEVKLGGTIESIKSARDLINQHVKDFMAQDEQGVKVPESLLSTFKMEYRKITQKYSKDDLMFYARENNSLIRIKGKKELVHSAVVELESLINLIETGSLIKNELFVPSRIHGKILGVEASNIKELIKEFDCDIQVPKFGQTGPVILIGPLENVQKCSDIIQSYCIEERLYKFPSASAKTSFLNSEKSSPILSQLKEWKQHPYGIILIGEIDQIEQVKREIQELEL